MPVRLVRPETNFTPLLHATEYAKLHINSRTVQEKDHD